MKKMYAILHRTATNKRQMAELMKVNFTRSSAVAERPRDAPWRCRFCYVTQDHSRSFEITPL